MRGFNSKCSVLFIIILLAVPTGLFSGNAPPGKEGGGSDLSGRNAEQSQVDAHHWTARWEMNDSLDYSLSDMVLENGRAELQPGQLAWDCVGPCQRDSHVTVCDPFHEKLIIQGGVAAGEQLNDTWAYDLKSSTWDRMADGPALAGHAGAWDGQNNQLLLFGGWTGIGQQKLSNEVWAFNLSANAWSRKASGSVARSNHSAVWDPIDKEMLIFGGDNGLQEFNDLWAYKPLTDTWSHGSSGATSRKGQGACWDSLDKLMLIFGGYPDRRDTWAYDPAADVWKQYDTLGGWLNDAGAVWDDQHNQMIVMFNQEMWAFNPATDTYTRYYDYFPLFGSPHAMVWSSRTFTIYYCAGAAAFFSFSPSAHYWRSEWGGYPEGEHSAVWDPLHEQMLVFGWVSGAWSPYIYRTPETWAYSLSKGTWTRKADWPNLSEGYTAVWDARDNQAILYGGSTWAYDPGTDAWSARRDGPPRDGQRAVWDSQNDQMIVFGGWDGSGVYNDVWTYNPSKDEWKLMNPGGAPPRTRFFPSAAWDSRDNQMLVFGGKYYNGSQSEYLNDLYAYMPSTNMWVLLGSAPRYAAWHAAVWDDRDDRMIICGGESVTGDSKDTWAYVPVSNSWVEQPAQLAWVTSSAAVWDGTDSRMFVYGGYDTNGSSREFHSYGVPYAPSGEIMAAGRLLSENLVSIDKVVLDASVPGGTSLDLWVRTADYRQSWANWTLIENGSRPPVQGMYFQWKAVLSSPQRYRTPTLGSLTVSFTTNAVPAVDLGGAFSAHRRETVHLNATVSDSESDPLTFSWNQTTGFPVDIHNPRDTLASFVAEVPGLYSFSFIAADTYGESAPASVNVTILNRRPLVDAPLQLTSFRHEVVLLNGSGKDGDEDELTFCWTQASGLPVKLQNISSPVASFVPTILGVYSFAFKARDSYDDSDTAVVTVTVKNMVPVADAGRDMIAHLRDHVLLNGSGWDGDGDPLAFNWSVVGGSPAVLLDADMPQATFVPKELGSFAFKLGVDDGFDRSAPSFVNVTVVNRPPRADAGPDLTVDVNESVQLQGGGEDDDHDSLSFRWVQVAGAPISLSDGNKRVAMFVPRAPGTYSFELTVNDTHEESSDTVNVTVVDRTHPPRFTSRPPTEARPGQPYRYRIRYTDNGGTGTCRLTLVSGPAGMVLDSPVISWMPNSSQEGRFNVSIALTDGYSTVFQNWTVRVTAGSGGQAPGFWSATSFLLVGALAVLVVCALIVGLMVRRRRRPPAQPQAPPSPRTAETAAISMERPSAPPQT
jgi:N-acetylneuraminic acid mutarotase